MTVNDEAFPSVPAVIYLAGYQGSKQGIVGKGENSGIEHLNTTLTLRF